jgi:hypothetical protein
VDFSPLARDKKSDLCKAVGAESQDAAEIATRISIVYCYTLVNGITNEQFYSAL